MNPEQHPLRHTARDLIRQKINRLVGRRVLSHEDGEDLEQCLIIQLWRSLRGYVPGRGHRRAFVRRIVGNFIASHLRGRKAAKRDTGEVRSLGTADPHRAGHDARRGCHPLDDEQAAHLALELAEVLAGLPTPLREMANAFLKAGTVAGAAERLGVHRGTANKRLASMREALRGSGFDDS